MKFYMNVEYWGTKQTKILDFSKKLFLAIFWPILAQFLTKILKIVFFSNKYDNYSLIALYDMKFCMNVEYWSTKQTKILRFFKKITFSHFLAHFGSIFDENP